MLRMKITEQVKKIRFPRLAIGVLLGAIAGYAYYYFVGCNSGSCAITSNPVNSTVYGMLFGGLLFFQTKNEDDNEAEK